MDKVNYFMEDHMANFKIDINYGTGKDEEFISAGKVRSGLSFVGQMPKFTTLATLKSKDNEFIR